MVVDEAFVELKTDDGRTYFWNRRENSRTWALPEGVSVKWVGQKAPDGRTYYWSRVNKETVWVLPPMPKPEPEAAVSSVEAGGATTETSGDLGAEGGPPVVRDEAEDAANADDMAEAADAAVQAAASARADEHHAAEPAAGTPAGGGGFPGTALGPLAMVSEASNRAGEPVPTAVRPCLAKATPEPAQASKGHLGSHQPQSIFRGEGEESPLLCFFPAIESPGPRGDSASAVAARHVIEKSGCDSWFRRLAAGEWEEVVRFWPPPDEVPLGRRPRVRRPKPDPYGLREMLTRCQKHEEIVRALFTAHHGTNQKFSMLKYPCPSARDWCFWTCDGTQLMVDSEKPLPLAEKVADGAFPEEPIVKRSPPEGERWRLLKADIRSKLSMVYVARKLRKLERAISKENRSITQNLLDQLTSTVPEKLAKDAQKLMAPPPPKPSAPSEKALEAPPPPATTPSSCSSQPASLNSQAPGQLAAVAFTGTYPSAGLAMPPSGMGPPCMPTAMPPSQAVVTYPAGMGPAAPSIPPAPAHGLAGMASAPQGFGPPPAGLPPPPLGPPPGPPPPGMMPNPPGAPPGMMPPDLGHLPGQPPPPRGQPPPGFGAALMGMAAPQGMGQPTSMSAPLPMAVPPPVVGACGTLGKAPPQDQPSPLGGELWSKGSPPIGQPSPFAKGKGLPLAGDVVVSKSSTLAAEVKGKGEGFGKGSVPQGQPTVEDSGKAGPFKVFGKMGAVPDIFAKAGKIAAVPDDLAKGGPLKAFGKGATSPDGLIEGFPQSKAGSDVFGKMSFMLHDDFSKGGTAKGGGRAQADGSTEVFGKSSSVLSSTGAEVFAKGPPLRPAGEAGRFTPEVIAPPMGAPSQPGAMGKGFATDSSGKSAPGAAMLMGKATDGMPGMGKGPERVASTVPGKSPPPPPPPPQMGMSGPMGDLPTFFNTGLVGMGASLSPFGAQGPGAWALGMHPQGFGAAFGGQLKGRADFGACPAALLPGPLPPGAGGPLPPGADALQPGTSPEQGAPPTKAPPGLQLPAWKAPGPPAPTAFAPEPPPGPGRPTAQAPPAKAPPLEVVGSPPAPPSEPEQRISAILEAPPLAAVALTVGEPRGAGKREPSPMSEASQEPEGRSPTAATQVALGAVEVPPRPQEGRPAGAAEAEAPWKKRRRGARGAAEVGPRLAGAAAETPQSAADAGVAAKAQEVLAQQLPCPQVPPPDRKAAEGTAEAQQEAQQEPRPGADRKAAERIAASAERLAAATGASCSSSAAARSAAAAAAAAADATAAAPEGSEGRSQGPSEGPREEMLKRKVIVSNVPPAAKSVELADFFTGAIFSATGHTLAAQWQSGEASKVVIAVELMPSVSAAGGRKVEVTFGTPLGAAVAVALNGIQFQGKALGLKRPKGYTGPAARTKLTGVSIKDLIASDPSPDGLKAAVGEAAGGKAGRGADGRLPPGTGGAKVKLSGIPSSMGSKSVFDLLQQFGGPLQSLNLSISRETGDHLGSGVAEYVDRASALEAAHFSPLLGFIEVTLMDAAASGHKAAASSAGLKEALSEAPKRQRRSRFDPMPAGAAEDLGPFEAALRRGPKASGPADNSIKAPALDLGPFESVLPASGGSTREAGSRTERRFTEDLGPFESVLPPPSGVSPPVKDAEDLGPFEAVLPPTKGATPSPLLGDPLDDLGPFGAVLKDRKTPEPAVDDLGPFAQAIHGFETLGTR